MAILAFKVLNQQNYNISLLALSRLQKFTVYCDIYYLFYAEIVHQRQQHKLKSGTAISHFGQFG